VMQTSFLKSKCIIVNMPFRLGIQLTVCDISTCLYGIVQCLCVRELFTLRERSTNEQCINVYVHTGALYEDSSLFDDDRVVPTSKASGTKAFQFQLDDPLLGLVAQHDKMADTLASSDVVEEQPSKEDRELFE